MVLDNTYADEFLVGCLLFGIFLAIMVGPGTSRKIPATTLSRLSEWVFILMVVYMLVESLRGLLILGGLQKIRWIVFYLMIGALSFVISLNNFPIPSGRKIALIVSGSTLAYLGIYIGHGLISEIVFGVNRYNLQLIYWGTSAYALFLVAVGVPSALLLFKDKNPFFKLIGWCTLLTAIFAAFYYDSRVCLLAIPVFLIALIPSFSFRKLFSFSLVFIFVVILGASFFLPSYYRDFANWKRDFLGFTETIYNPRKSNVDIDRLFLLQSAFQSIGESLETCLFGYGFRTYGYIISPKMRELYAQNNNPEMAKKVKEDVGAETFTALVVDTGIVGLFLLVINFLLVGLRIFFQKGNSNRIMLLSSLLIISFWSLVIYYLDIVLFYFAIMPSGLLIQLSRYTPKEPRAEENN